MIITLKVTRYNTVVFIHDICCHIYTDTIYCVVFFRNFSIRNKIDLQLELTRYIYTQLKRLDTNGSDILINCPTLFDEKESVKLILGLLSISDKIANAFILINKILKVNFSFVVYFTIVNTFR